MSASLSQVVAGFIGQQSVLTISVPVLKLLNGDFKAAILLERIISESRGEFAWVARSYQEWEDNFFLSRREVIRAVGKLKAITHNSKTLLETRVARSARHQEAPTVHYRYNAEVLQKALEAYFSGNSEDEVTE